jgi:hypothetical protein
VSDLRLAFSSFSEYFSDDEPSCSNIPSSAPIPGFLPLPAR